LKRSVSRTPGDDVVTFRDGNVALFKVDVGAFGESAFLSGDSGSVSMLAGEPLLNLAPQAASGGRSRDLELMHEAFGCEEWTLFSGTQGVYCAAHYEPRSVTLVCDRLGLRPIYYWIGEDYIIFASALRILESLAEVPKKMDLVAVTEIAILGCPVGNRTPYTEIKGLKAGEILRLTPERADSLRYWRWDSIQPSALAQKTQLEEIYQRFENAVSRRLHEDTAVFASLSGGLDSRCVVAALRNQSIKVHSLNFYEVLDSQDQVFAADFARHMGTIHRAVPVGDMPAPFQQRVTDAWRAWPPSPDSVPERPQMLWMGDGGSVGLGHVFVERDIVTALRGHEIDKAIGAYRGRLVPRLLKNGFSSAVTRLVVEDIRRELQDLHFEDPARSFHMFLMLYEQRYDLSPQFENIDIHRLEFQLPFFDGEFLASIVSAPVDACLDHDLYTDWLSLFPPPVTAVPWQAYPGHRQCPLPIPEGLAYQWDQAPAGVAEARKRKLLQMADQVLGADGFPDLILRKRVLQLARWFCKTGLRDGQSTIRAAETYYRYWAACGGQFVTAAATTLEQ
jgi:hypothetical protein